MFSSHNQYYYLLLLLLSFVHLFPLFCSVISAGHFSLIVFYLFIFCCGHFVFARFVHSPRRVSFSVSVMITKIRHFLCVRNERKKETATRDNHTKLFTFCWLLHCCSSPKLPWRFLDSHFIRLFSWIQPVNSLLLMKMNSRTRQRCIKEVTNMPPNLRIHGREFNEPGRGSRLFLLVV